ncbi:MAG: YcbK family protein [Hyphomicrobiaceae bacterium]
MISRFFAAHRSDARTWRSRAVITARFAILPVLALALSCVAQPGTASAEVRSVTNFMPPSWKSDDATPITRASRRSASRRAVRSSHARSRHQTRSRSHAKSRYATSRSRHTKQQRRIRVASLGSSLPSVSKPKPRASLSGGSIAWRAGSGCLASNLRAVIASVAANYGSVTVNSTCRSKRHNRRVGGAPRSYHLTGNAVDFRVRGNARSVYAYLRQHVGGLKHYGGGRFHIDNGPRRTF